MEPEGGIEPAEQRSSTAYRVYKSPLLPENSGKSGSASGRIEPCKMGYESIRLTRDTRQNLVAGDTGLEPVNSALEADVLPLD